MLATSAARCRLYISIGTRCVLFPSEKNTAGCAMAAERSKKMAWERGTLGPPRHPAARGARAAAAENDVSSLQNRVVPPFRM